MVGGSSRGPRGFLVSLLVPSPVSEVISRWLEAVPGAPGGSWFLCSFLHLFRRSSQGGWRQFHGLQIFYSLLCSLAPEKLFSVLAGSLVKLFTASPFAPLFSFSTWLQIGFFLPFPLGETSGAFCHRAGALSWLPCRALLGPSPLSLFVRFLVLFRPLSFFLAGPPEPVPE